MSFFSNNRTDRCPGPITGNPINGLCEKVCINTTKVFDSCMNQIHIEDLTLELTNITPTTVTYPLTFVSCASNGQATLTDLVIDRFDDRPNFARVSVDVGIPITITYTDANGIAGSGSGVLTVSEDVVMSIPQASIIPFRVEAFGAAICSDGEFVGDNTFQITTCTTVILRIVAEVQLMVPSYGFCPIPPCQEYSNEICPGTFDLPLFPTNANWVK